MLYNFRCLALLAVYRKLSLVRLAGRRRWKVLVVRLMVVTNCRKLLKLPVKNWYMLTTKMSVIGVMISRRLVMMLVTRVTLVMLILVTIVCYLLVVMMTCLLDLLSAWGVVVSWVDHLWNNFLGRYIG